MKNLMITLLSIISFAPAFAQVSRNYSTDMQTRGIYLDDWEAAFGMSENEFDDIKDQAYDNPTFLTGGIFKDDQLAQKNVAMRYNANSDEIEIKNSTEKDDYSALSKTAGLYAKIADETYVFVPYQGSVENGHYFNVVTSGKTYDLYKKTTAIFNEKKYAKTSYDSDIPANFTKNVSYYLVDKGGTFYELPSSESKILKVMGEKKAEMKSYIKLYNLDLDKQKDLAKLVDHFNQVL